MRSHTTISLLLGLCLFGWAGVLHAQVDESLRIENAGLMSYSRIENSLGSVPVSVAYYRGGIRFPQLYWSALEPAPGVYNFSAFIDILNEAQAAGVTVGIRIVAAMPVGNVRPYPHWIPAITRTDGNMTVSAPDWERTAVKQAVSRMLNALGAAIRSHPAFLFADIGVLGWAGEWHGAWGPWRDEHFMPSIAVQKEYVNYHVDAFGASKLVVNLDMPGEVIRYALARGANGWRHDGFGHTDRMLNQYPNRFRNIPALWNVTGPRIFEIWGSNISEWPDAQVTWPIDLLFDEAAKYHATLFANMGNRIPDEDLNAYLKYHRAIQAYLEETE